MYKKVKVLLTMMIWAVLLTACGNNASVQNTSTQITTTPKVTSESDTMMFTDSCGREVEIPSTIERIAPSGGLSQQVLLTIAPNKLVGLSNKIPDSSAVFLGTSYQALPVFGQFYGSGNLNMEALAATDPQLIIDIGEAKKSVKEDMDSIQKQTGIPTIFVEASLDTMSEAYTILGKVLGEEDQGAKLATYCSDVLNNIKTKMENIPQKDRVNFIYAQGDTGLFVIGKGSFHAQVMDMLGNNVAELENATNKGSGNEISAEQLMLWNPDLVIFGPGSIYPTVKDDDVWKELSAIKNETYYEVPNNPYNWMGMPPSINRYLGMQWMANLFYPEAFKYDMYQVTAQYYKLFYHYDLTKEVYQKLTAHSVK